MRLTFYTLLASSLSAAEPLDTLSFGDAASEAAHGLVATLSDTQPGGLGEPTRRLLPGGSEPWRGGTLQFKAKVDPARQNYLTLRLWGEDVNQNQMTLHLEGKQIGYRHLGDIEALDIGTAFRPPPLPPGPRNNSPTPGWACRRRPRSAPSSWTSPRRMWPSRCTSATSAPPSSATRWRGSRASSATG